MRYLTDVKLHLIENIADVIAFEAWFLAGPQQHGMMGVDTESTGLDIRRDRIRTIQLGDDIHGWTIPWERWSGIAEDAISRFAGTVVMHHLAFDFPLIRRHGITVNPGQIVDTLPLMKITEPHMSAGLKPSAGRHVDPAANAAQKELDAAIAKLGWDGVPIKFGPYWQYAALDPVLTVRLAQDRIAAVEAQGAQEAAAVETAVLFVLDKMIQRGTRVDVDYASQARDKFHAYSKQAAAWCQKEYGVSPGSNVAVVRKMEEHGFEFSKLTATGAVALDKEVLGDIDHPLAKTVLKRRQYDKLASTYLTHYIEHSVDGIIFPSINSTGARTGRMSVSEPNLQNLPRVSEGNPAANIVRNCIIPREGNVLIFCDFSQIETRLLAHLSNDPGLIAAFHSDGDFFVTLARTIFNDETIGKKDPRRNIIKTLVYAKIYGAGLEKMASTLGITMPEMIAIDNGLRAAYPGIKRFQDEVSNEAFRNVSGFRGENPYVICPLSGRKHVADRGKEYALVNYLIQGMAAHFFKTKLLELDAAGLGEWMILPVHDEIILDIPVEQAPWAVDILTKIMNDRDTLRVPVSAEVSFGYRWGEKKDWTEWEAAC